MQNVIRHLRRAALLRDGGGLADEQLLECFLAQRDNCAFEALLRRHGPMVLGVCRRVLGSVHDAEDAFQATFLVLVRRAASVYPRHAVGPWLYGVAYRTAMKARVMAARRRAREMRVAEGHSASNTNGAGWDELSVLLDDELSRLPEKYRAPVVLCYLEGRRRKDVARQLGWPEGTLSGRLARARVLLARRLSGRGVALSGGALAAVLSQSVASASVPAALTVSTMKVAALLAAGHAAAGVIPAPVAALTGGVIRAMSMIRLKIVTLVLLMAAALGAGVGIFTVRQALASDRSTVLNNGTPAPSKEAAKPKSDQELLQGAWVLSESTVNGTRAPAEDLLIVFVGDTLGCEQKGKIDTRSFVLAPTETPKAIDMSDGKTTTPGIYRLEGDTLALCIGHDGRPKGFTSVEGGKTELHVLKRHVKGQALKLDEAAARITLTTTAANLVSLMEELRKEPLDAGSELKALERIEKLVELRKRELLKKADK
jgi:RNA polymerase sigma factor (sigma-70 family)